MTIKRFCCLMLALVLGTAMYAQDKKVSISADNESITSVMAKIEQATGYAFFYNDNVIDKDRKVTFRATDEKVENVLGRLFNGTDTSFSIIDGNIVLSRKGDVARDEKKVSGGGRPVAGSQRSHPR